MLAARCCWCPDDNSFNINLFLFVCQFSFFYYIVYALQPAANAAVRACCRRCHFLANTGLLVLLLLLCRCLLLLVLVLLLLLMMMAMRMMTHSFFRDMSQRD